LLTGQQGVRLTRSPVNGSLVNKFRREVPVNWTVLLTGTECILFLILSILLIIVVNFCLSANIVISILSYFIGLCNIDLNDVTLERGEIWLNT